MTDRDSHTDSGSTSSGAGARLKEARIAQGLSVKDIASRLNLKIEIVEALENGQDEKLPVSTYVRGYIRSYAKIVNLDGNELISLYENNEVSPPEIIPDVRSTSQVSSRDKPVRAVTYLVTFILALLLIAWLQGNYVIKSDITDPVSDNRNIKPVPEVPIMEETPQQTEDTVYYYPGINLDDYSPENRGMGEPDRSTDLVIDGPGLLELNEIQEDTQHSENDRNRTNASPASTDRIKFILNGESWIEVSDAQNRKLYIGLAKTGEEVQLKGSAPFNVLLGYSPAVEVLYNGEVFDTAPFSEAGIARFTLGE